jgi:hypothetical protein
MRFFSAMIMVVMTGQAAHALDDELAKQTDEALKVCNALFDQKFGKGKTDRFTNCINEQTDKATEACYQLKQDEMKSCADGKVLSVRQACDLTRC